MMAGTYDAERKTLTMTGEGPGLDRQTVKYKNTTTHTDKDHQTFKMYQVERGQGNTDVYHRVLLRKK